MMLKNPKSWQIKRILREIVTLRKVTETAISEDEYGMTEESTKDYSIKVQVIPLTTEDLIWLKAGGFSSGDIRVFSLSSYDLEGQTIIPQVEDKIIYNGISFRIDKKTSYNTHLELMCKRESG